LLRASSNIDTSVASEADIVLGFEIVKKALSEPARQIVDNAGLEAPVIVNKIMEGDVNYGFDARKEEFGDMIKFGIIDPTLVTRTAVENAASVAGLLLTTESVVSEKKEDNPPAPAMPPGGGMGGMDGMY
ncbi:MAG: TCP-1/cpn60 chaperonin family protein, partial [Fidelibacterota bacterium]